MAEEVKTSVSKDVNTTTQETANPEQDYISALAEMKENSVPKDKYEALAEDNKKLLKTLVDGGQLVQPSTEDSKSVDDLRKSFNGDMTNLAYCENALALRTALIEKGERDPFLPYGEGVVPTNEDVEAANRVAETFQDCIDYAQGDPDAFTNELMRRTVDSAPMARRR